MKISKEARVGLLAIVTLTLFYFGFNFLKGSDLFTRENEYITYYPNVAGLKVSNAVTLSGVTVGRVKSIVPEQTAGRVKVVFTVDDEIQLTNKTVAVLGSSDLLSGKEIQLLIEPGKNVAEKVVIPGQLKADLVTSMTQKIDPTIQKVDSLMLNLNRIVAEYENSGVAMKTLMASATQTSNSVNGVVVNNAKSLQEVTRNAAVLTQSLNTLTRDLDQQMKPILANTNQFTNSLNELQLRNTVTQLNTTVASLQTILKDINRGQGTLGKLTQDEALYRNLNATTASLNALLVDLKASPKRYVHFSLFGRKDEKQKPTTVVIDEAKLANPVMLDTLRR